MTTITVNVTQDHINNGMRGQAFRCMVALALKDNTFFQGDGIYVYSTHFVLPMRRFPSSSLFHDLPDFVQAAIHQFDVGMKVEPFSFSLEMPTPVPTTSSPTPVPEASGPEPVPTPHNLDIGKPERVITREEPALPVPQYAPITPKAVPITPEREPVKVNTTDVVTSCERQHGLYTR